MYRNYIQEEQESIQKNIKSFIHFKESYLKQKRLKKEELKNLYLKGSKNDIKMNENNFSNKINILDENESDVIKKDNNSIIMEFSDGEIIKEEIKYLTKYPNSVLAAFINGKITLPQRNGHFFVDRNSKDFKLLLHFLKKTKLPKFQNIIEEKNFFREMLFWRIPIKATSKKKLQFDLNMTHNCFNIDKTKTILNKKNNLHGITVLNRGLKATSPFVEFTLYLNNSLSKNKKIFFGLIDKDIFENKYINNSFEDRSAPYVFYWDLFRNKIVKNKNKSDNISLGFEKECRCFLNMNEIKIGMKYNQFTHSIKLYRNYIELGVEIQNVNPGLYPAIEIYMEECKIKLSLNNDYQENFYL